MSSVGRRIRWLKEIVEAEGGQVLALRRGKHLKLKLSNGRTFTTAVTPSDWRTDLNDRAVLRRLLKEPTR